MSGKAARRAVRERLDIERVVKAHPLPWIGTREDIAETRRFCREECDRGVMRIARAWRAYDLKTALAERTETP